MPNLSPVSWSIAQQVGRVLLSFIFYFAIISFLAPAEVGIVAIATVWIAFLGVFLDLGFGSAIVQRREIADPHLGTVFWMNIGIGVLLFLVSAALSWPISALMRIPEAQPVILVLSAGFVVSALGSLQAAVAARRLRYRALALRDLAGVMTGGTVGLVLAWGGAGVWSLVIQTLTSAAVGTALLWKLSPYRPRPSDWSIAALRDLWGFSSRLFGATVFKYFIQHADTLVLGYFFGPARLGLYSLANRVVTQPISAVESGVGAVLFSRASRLQDNPAQVAELYARAYKGLNYLVLPFVAAAGVWGGLVVPGIMGKEWEGTGLIFTYLAIMGLVHPPVTPVGQLMKALGKPDWFLRWSIAFGLATNGALLVGAQFGFNAALGALAAAYVAMVPVAFFIVHRLLPGTLSKVLRTLRPSYLASVLFALVLVSLKFWAGNQLSVALVSSAVGLILYILLLRRWDPAFAALVRSQVMRIRTA